MNLSASRPLLAFALVSLLSACATVNADAPAAKVDAPVQVQPAPEPLAPMKVVEVAQPLPLPGQLKPLADQAEPAPIPEPVDPQQRIAKANDEARVAPSRDGYLNAIQVWPYAEGALYQLYASPGRVTDIMLQEGEQLVSVSAGDTVRWIVGDTTSASGPSQRVHVLLKPIRAPLKTNLVITTNRRIYLLEVTATEKSWMASASWSYPSDQLALLKRQGQRAEAKAPIAQGVQLERLRFGYAISGDTPPWRPLRAFDDGERVYLQFPPGIGQRELPPVFVTGVSGSAELVNFRYRPPYYIVDRLFDAAELRLGGDKAQVVRIVHTDRTAEAP